MRASWSSSNGSSLKSWSSCRKPPNTDSGTIWTEINWFISKGPDKRNDCPGWCVTGDNDIARSTSVIKHTPNSWVCWSVLGLFSSSAWRWFPATSDGPDESASTLSSLIRDSPVNSSPSPAAYAQRTGKPHTISKCYGDTNTPTRLRKVYKLWSTLALAMCVFGAEATVEIILIILYFFSLMCVCVFLILLCVPVYVQLITLLLVSSRGQQFPPYRILNNHPLEGIFSTLDTRAHAKIGSHVLFLPERLRWASLATPGWWISPVSLLETPFSIWRPQLEWTDTMVKHIRHSVCSLNMLWQYS